MLESTDGTFFNQPTKLTPDSSYFAPNIIQAGSELILAWSSNDSSNNLFTKLSTTGIGGFANNNNRTLARHGDQSRGSFALAQFLGEYFIAWTGWDGSQRINLTNLKEFAPI